MTKWIDRIDTKGDIRAHVDVGNFRTLCGLKVEQWQKADGNRKCCRCLRILLVKEESET